VIVLLFSLILFFANQVLLIFVLVSMLFLSYVLATVRPDTIHNMITTYGIRYQNKLYFWEDLGNFWITEHNGKYQIHIEAPVFLSNRIVLLPSNDSSPIYVQMEDIVDLLARYLPYQEPTPTQIDRWVLWVQEKFPLESPQKQKQSFSQSSPSTNQNMNANRNEISTPPETQLPQTQNANDLRPTEVPKL